MTQVVVVADSFKGSGSSLEIEKIIKKGILKVNDKVNVVTIPIADGGEGTVDCLVQAQQGHFHSTAIRNPYGAGTITATWGMLDEQTAVIEVAAAVGLPAMPKHVTATTVSSYGVGQLILAALNEGATRLYVGLGGSASNDGGIGMAQALGVRFYDAQHHVLTAYPDVLQHLATLDITELDSRLATVELIGLSDVDNPLLGENGATATFGQQKGLSQSDQEKFEHYLHHYHQVVCAQGLPDQAETAGAGAAGGLGYGLLTFAQAKIKPGIATIMELIALPEKMAQADLVITGEGRIDRQSLHGKLPVGVARLAQRYQVPVMAIVGSIGVEVSEIYQLGFSLVISATSAPMTLKEAQQQKERLIGDAATSAFQVFQSLTKRS